MCEYPVCSMNQLRVVLSDGMLGYFVLVLEVLKGTSH